MPEFVKTEDDVLQRVEQLIRAAKQESEVLMHDARILANLADALERGEDVWANHGELAHWP